MATREVRKGSIRTRLTLGGLALALVPVLVAIGAVSLYADRQAEASLTERALDQLDATRAGKAAEIQSYFRDVANVLLVLAANEQIRGAMTSMPRELLAVPETAGVTLDQARQALVRYYGEDFDRQYRQRNQGTASEMAQLPPQLPPVTAIAQHLYVSANPNPLGSKNNLDRATDPSAYSESHARLQPFVRRIYERYGFYDVFLVEPENGYVVYTFFKELDFATSLVTGPWSRSGLAEAFLAARDSKDANAVLMSDYKAYKPSYEDQAAFVSTRIMDGERLLGVLIVQLPIDKINAVMTFENKWKDVGLGESGEIYLVGPNYLPRSISRFVVEDRVRYLEQVRALGAAPAALASIEARGTNVGALPMKTRGIENALRGQSGREIFPDYRNVPVLSAYSPIDVLGHRWSIMSEIDESEALAPVVTLRRGLIVAALVTLLVVGLVGAWIALKLARSINAPLSSVQSAVRKVAEGDLSARTELTTQDEIGTLGQAFDRMLDEKVTELARAAKENETLNTSVIGIMQSVAQLARRDLTVKVPVQADVTGTISDAINMMTSETTKALKQVSALSGNVADASARVRQRSDDVLQVATSSGAEASAASGELANAARGLREIAEQAQRASKSAESAIGATGEAMSIVRATIDGISLSRDQIRETEKRVKRLGERSQEISSVVAIIGQIAERTSVLALNASMQAVAAGDAGRGFAVVADEVKRLAENARQATQQIASLVSAIQADTVETTQAMNSTIAQVVDISKLAERAGSQMQQTRTTTEDLVNSVRGIVSTTEIQARNSDSLLNRARQLMDASQKTLVELGEQRKETESLQNSSRGLLDTVNVFRLPA